MNVQASIHRKKSVGLTVLNAFNKTSEINEAVTLGELYCKLLCNFVLRSDVCFTVTVI